MQVTHPAGEDVEEEQQSLFPALASLCSSGDDQNVSTKQICYAARCLCMLASQDMSPAARGLIDEAVVKPLSSVLGRGEAAAEVSLYDPMETPWPSEKAIEEGAGTMEDQAAQESKQEAEGEEDAEPLPGSFTPRSEAAAALRALKALSTTASVKSFVQSEEWPEDLDREQPEAEEGNGDEEGDDPVAKTPPFVLPSGFVMVNEAFFSVTTVIFGALTSESTCRSANLEDSVRVALFEIVAEMAAVDGGLENILTPFRPSEAAKGDEEDAEAKAGDDGNEGDEPGGPMFIAKLAYDENHFHDAILKVLIATIKGMDGASSSQRLVAIRALMALTSVSSNDAALQSLEADHLAQSAILKGVLGHLIAIKLNTSLDTDTTAEGQEDELDDEGKSEGKEAPSLTLVAQLKNAAFELFTFLASRGEVREEHFREQQRKADEEAAAAAA